MERGRAQVREEDVSGEAMNELAYALKWAAGMRLDANGRTAPEPHAKTLASEVIKCRAALLEARCFFHPNTDLCGRGCEPQCARRAIVFPKGQGGS